MSVCVDEAESVKEMTKLLRKSKVIDREGPKGVEGRAMMAVKEARQVSERGTINLLLNDFFVPLPERTSVQQAPPYDHGESYQ
jgi:hypothetical protein